jgi:pyruvate dehydrogenase E2 component (dihydrolipoamide acetyltransferase)
MPIPIEMPKLSDTMTDGVLLKWRKQPGDKITMGDILAEVETDKATMEMEAFDEGILHKVYVEAGGKAAVGSRIALLLEPGEKPPADDDLPAQPAPASPAPPAAPAKAAPAKASAAATAPAAPGTPAPAAGGRIKSSPLARKVAAEKGVDLARVQGSGPGGRIVRQDVLDAPASGGSAGAPSPSALASTVGGLAPGSERRVPLSGMRRVIAERLVASKTQIPHFYLTIDIDAAPLLRTRAELKAAGEGTGLDKITLNDFILRAAALAASRVPKVNAAWDGDAIIEYGSVHLAVAVAIEDGLLTPVIRDAQAKSLRQISVEMKDLASRARGKKLKPEEYQGGTLSVSSLGQFGVESFQAIINPPQALILAIGAITKQPVVGPDDTLTVGHRMKLGLSGDHRVIDGALGAQYAGEIKKLVENPAMLLV